MHPAPAVLLLEEAHRIAEKKLGLGAAVGARLGAQVIGVDPSESNIAAAKLHAERSHLSIDYRCTTLEQMDARERFDIVLEMEVVEHVTDVGAFLDRCAAIMKPSGLMVVVVGPKIGALISRFGVRRVLLAGLAAFVPCYLLMFGIGPEPDLWGVLLPASVLWGVGFALSISALMVAGTSGVADEEQGLAAGLLNSSLQVGGACGLAVLTAAIGPGTELGMLYAGVGVMLGFAVLALVVQVRSRAARR